ncbi:hypothetical protein PHYPSEUDO_006473 [Phytophthora pseudosyringae]|uniref:Ankyrin repeat protein n=1 Tax=Phytophthora pseudosyringae TaxID=221518 RepID=A0A8T1VIJ8_9STRA|nr:hypothetical protein PHYPSEUDO_006473 [Phytophthora pseudosyringae]
MEIPHVTSSIGQLEVGSPTAATRGGGRCPPLHHAALEGNVALVERMLKDGEDPDMRDEWTKTPIITMLVRHGLQETRCIFQERNPVRRNLVTDCREEDAERTATTTAILNIFLQHGANPDARSSGGKTALHYAISDGLCEATRILLDAGATIDAQDKDGRSSLYCAVQERSLLVTNLLVSYGASIDLQDKNDVSPLSLTVEKGYVDVMQIFLNAHALVATRERMDFAGEVLFQAVKGKSTDIVRLLVESGYVALDYQNAAGETAMHHAITLGNTQLVKTLCALDPTDHSLRVVTARGESCFHFAARVGSARELEIMLQFRSQVAGDQSHDLLNSIDTFGTTPLLAAATTTESRYSDDKTNQFIDRRVKMQLLLSNGAMLFRNDTLPGGSPFRRSSQGSGITLGAKVRRCLIQWFEECQDEKVGEMLREFSTKWIAHVPSTRESATILSMLSLCVCSGYTLEVLPLLLMLPQEQAAITSFLQSLDVFECCSNGLQFECLAHELRATWA